MEILPEPGWQRLLVRLWLEQGTIMLLGATDSGKTTFARYLVDALAKKLLTTALIDSDIGQSGIGLPGTITMKVFRDAGDLGDFRFERMTFLGFTNPSKVIPLMVAMTRRMTDIGRRRAGIAVVDTTGLISGELGKALKIAKIGAIRPRHVVAIQRGDELEHILSLIRDTKIHRLRASAAAKKRSPSTRRAYRKRKLQEYFRAREQYEHTLDVQAVQFFCRGRQVRPGEKEISHGALIGLNRNSDTVGLGIAERIEEAALIIRTPLKSLRGIDRVVFGEMTMP